MHDAPHTFEYALEALAPGRVGFHRWRWELWRGASLLACGWRVTPGDAERALSSAASRSAHERLGVRVLRPDQARTQGRFAGGATVRVESGAVECLLVPRQVPEPARSAA